MSDSSSDYQLGSADDELARLELQGRALAQATFMIFDAAGIRPGMRVLDLGCGVGDVAFVAADLVGPDGYVVGVDRSPEALARPESAPGNVAWRRWSSLRATSTTRRQAGRSMPWSSGQCSCMFPTRPRSCGDTQPCCALAASSCR